MDVFCCYNNNNSNNNNNNNNNNNGISVDPTEWLFYPLFPGHWNLEKLDFVEGGKPEYPEKIP